MRVAQSERLPESTPRTRDLSRDKAAVAVGLRVSRMGKNVNADSASAEGSTAVDDGFNRSGRTASVRKKRYPTSFTA